MQIPLDDNNDRHGYANYTSPLFRTLMNEKDQTKADYNTLLSKCELRFDSTPVVYDKDRKPSEFPSYESQRNRKASRSASRTECCKGDLEGASLRYPNSDLLYLSHVCLVNSRPRLAEMMDTLEDLECEDGHRRGAQKAWEALRRERAPCHQRAGPQGVALDNWTSHFEHRSTGEDKENRFPKPRVHAKATEDFEIHIEDILLGIDRRTTCMIKNIPNKYTQRMLIDLLNENHMGAYNFFYLRMDFKNKCNVGYAFVNFANCMSIVSFYRKMHGKSWRRFTSNKICELTYASIQGFEKLVNKFRNSTIMLEKDSFRPKAFYTKGDKAGMERYMT